MTYNVNSHLSIKDVTILEYYDICKYAIRLRSSFTSSPQFVNVGPICLTEEILINILNNNMGFIVQSYKGNMENLKKMQIQPYDIMNAFRHVGYHSSIESCRRIPYHLNETGLLFLKICCIIDTFHRNMRLSVKSFAGVCSNVDNLVGISFNTILDNIFLGYRLIKNNIPKYNILTYNNSFFIFNIKITITDLVKAKIKIKRTKNRHIIFKLSRNESEIIFTLPRIDLIIYNFLMERYMIVSNYASVYIALACMIKTDRDLELAQEFDIVTEAITLHQLDQLSKKELEYCNNNLIENLEMIYEFLCHKAQMNNESLPSELPHQHFFFRKSRFPRGNHHKVEVQRAITYVKKQTSRRMRIYFSTGNNHDYKTFENVLFCTNTLENGEAFSTRIVFSKLNSKIEIHYKYNDENQNSIENRLLNSTLDEKENIISEIFKDI